MTEEHPDTQKTVTSIISKRSIHNHDAIQYADALHDENDSQSVLQTPEQHMKEFEKDNIEAIELAWSDICVTSNDGKKTFLTGASGAVKASFLAIMGPSGAGKSTLMNVLACRLGNAASDGEKVVDGMDYSLTELKQMSGYVMQDDLLNGHLTVYETLYYTAELRLPSNMTKEEKHERIEEVLEMLGLTHTRDTLIGTAMEKGISGGERKRVCVGMELLTRPRLLFLDEPTSGLDSVTAWSLCQILRDLAHSGKCTVITTIHQPQSKIFAMFDDLILLKKGRIVYYGSAGEVVDFFAEAGFPCPDRTNPADHILDVITYNPSKPGSKEEVAAAEKKLNALRDEQVVDIDRKKAQNQASEQSSKLLHRGNRASWWHQFVILLHRSSKEVIRAKDVFFTLLILNVIIAILIGFAFFQIGTGQQSAVLRQPVLFFCVINQGIFGALMTINAFPKERVLVLRERAAGTYHASAYFLAKNLADSVGQIIAPMVFSVIVYFLIGLQMNAAKFFIFMIFMVMTSLSATSLALMVSTLARTTDMSVTILPLILEITRLFGGFFLSPANLPPYFAWLDALSYVKYAYTAISLNELNGLTLTCKDSELKDGKCPITSGQQTIDQLGLDYLSIEACFFILIAYVIFFRFIAYLGLRFIKN